MKYLAIPLFLVLTQQLSAQNFGFFNKKNIVEVSLMSSYPLIYRLADFSGRDVYGFGEDDQGTYYFRRSDYVDLAYNLNYFRSISKGFSLGLEFEYRKINAPAPTDFVKRPYSNYYYDYFDELQSDYTVYGGQHEALNCNYFHVIPKIEFSSKGGIFGMGVNHQIGAGVATVSLKEQEYAFNLEKHQESYNYAIDVPLSGTEKKEFRTNFFDYNHNKYKFLLFSYSINFRKPITKFLMLGYGFRYNLTYMKGFRDRFNEETDYAYWMSHREAGNQIYPKVMTNILQLKLGVTYLF